MTTTDQSVLTEDTRWPLRLAGFLAIALGILALISPLFAGLVVTLAAWALGVLVGINLIVEGGTLLAFAKAAD